MHNYKKIYTDLLAKGFSPAEAFRIVHVIKIEDCITEQLYAEERRNEEKKREEIQRFWELLAKLEDYDRYDIFFTLPIIVGQMKIEKEQRQQLLKTLNRSPSVFLPNVLKTFYGFPDQRISLVAGVLNPAASPTAEDFLNGLVV